MGRIHTPTGPTVVMRGDCFSFLKIAGGQLDLGGTSSTASCCCECLHSLVSVLYKFFLVHCVVFEGERGVTSVM